MLTRLGTDRKEGARQRKVTGMERKWMKKGSISVFPESGVFSFCIHDTLID